MLTFKVTDDATVATGGTGLLDMKAVHTRTANMCMEFTVHPSTFALAAENDKGRLTAVIVADGPRVSGVMETAWRHGAIGSSVEIQLQEFVDVGFRLPSQGIDGALRELLDWVNDTLCAYIHHVGGDELAGAGH